MLKLVVGRTTSIFDSTLKLTLSVYKNTLNNKRYLWFETINHVEIFYNNFNNFHYEQIWMLKHNMV